MQLTLTISGDTLSALWKDAARSLAALRQGIKTEEIELSGCDLPLFYVGERVRLKAPIFDFPAQIEGVIHRTTWGQENREEYYVVAFPKRFKEWKQTRDDNLGLGIELSREETAALLEKC